MTDSLSNDGFKSHKNHAQTLGLTLMGRPIIRVGFLPEETSFFPSGRKKGFFPEETGRNWKKWKISKLWEKVARMLA